MMKKSMTIALKDGLEARPIAELVQVASKYDSRIYIEIGTKRVNAKSIMGMMSLELDNGDEMTVSADGADEEAAIRDIEAFISSKYTGITEIPYFYKSFFRYRRERSRTGRQGRLWGIPEGVFCCQACRSGSSQTKDLKKRRKL